MWKAMTVGGRGGKFVVAGGAGAGGHGGAAAGGGDACGACCFEADPEAVRHEERWVYVGEGAGSYSQVANMEMVGAGRGEFEKERYTTVTGWRVRACCVGTTCFLTVIAILLPIAWANDWWSSSISWDVGNECVGIDAVAMMEAMDQHSVMFRQNCCLQVLHAGEERSCSSHGASSNPSSSTPSDHAQGDGTHSPLQLRLRRE